MSRRLSNRSVLWSKDGASLCGSSTVQFNRTEAARADQVVHSWVDGVYSLPIVHLSEFNVAIKQAGFPRAKVIYMFEHNFFYPALANRCVLADEMTLASVTLSPIILSFNNFVIPPLKDALFLSILEWHLCHFEVFGQSELLIHRRQRLSV